MTEREVSRNAREAPGDHPPRVIDDTQLFTDKLQEWEDFYNYHRPHGGLGGQTPYERLKQKTTNTLQRTPVRRTPPPPVVKRHKCGQGIG